MSKVPSIRLNGKPSRPRNSFDVSERSLYSQPVGAIMPVFVRDLNPGDHLDVKIASLLQAQTLKGRAFFNGKQKFAGFFVPYKQLWSGWESFITNLRPGNTFNSTTFFNATGSALKPITRSNGFEYPIDDGSFVASNFPGFYPYDIYDVIKGELPESNPFAKDAHGIKYSYNYARLLDLLGYGNLINLSINNFGDFSSAFELGKLKNMSASLFRFAAYQKIYHDYFLDDTFEFRNIYSWNLDYFSQNFTRGLLSSSYVKPDTSNGETVSRAASVFQLRYAHYEKDLLSNLIPYQLDQTNMTLFTSLPAYDRETTVSADGVIGVTNGFESPSILKNSAVTSVANIRAAFALDKLLQISSRAGKTYKEQIAAHYGENVSNSVRMSKFCGGFDTNLDVNAVVATGAGSPTSDGVDASYLGQQGGFIDNGVGGRIVCDADDFGVFMIVSYVTVEPRYDNYVDPFVFKRSRSDFFIPEYEDLGLQPVYRYNYGLSGTDDMNAVLSWQPRYSEYKTSFNRLHGIFARKGSLNFLTPRKDFKIHDKKRLFDSSMFLISPKSLDNTVEVVYDGSLNTDPFRVETHFAASLISNMSVSGLAKMI